MRSLFEGEVHRRDSKNTLLEGEVRMWRIRRLKMRDDFCCCGCVRVRRVFGV
jgi:hypothetical protein